MRSPHNHVGRCIYCDSTEGLTREHVMPEGLGGRKSPDGHHEALVLRAATCKSCSEKTRDIEGNVLGTTLGHYREKAGFRPKHRRQKERTVKLIGRYGGETLAKVPIEAIPALVLLPVFHAAGIVLGRRAKPPYPIRFFANYEKEPSSAFRSLEGCPVGISPAVIQPGVFAQMLAKIALGAAVSRLGIDGFRPTVRELIAGDLDEFPQWVGGPGQSKPEPPHPYALHEMHLDTWTSVEDRTFHVVRIRLFANLGGPRNYVVVGESL